jgi:thiol peroxidase
MAHVLLGSESVTVAGNLPAVGTPAPDFRLTGNDLKEVTLASYADKKIILNIFPSIDTKTCATSVREFNRRAAALHDTLVLCIAKDLPYAMKRFCGAEGIDKVITLSDFRNKGFSQDYGVEMVSGIMAGLFARAIVVIGKDRKITHTELVPVIGQEPNYETALSAL